MLKIIFLLVILPMLIIPAFADHMEITITTIMGSNSPVCKNTMDGCFIPNMATVDMGGTVIFLNSDSGPHTFTAGSVVDGLTNEFDTGLVKVAHSYEWIANVIGEIPYFCMIHPWMNGVLIVEDRTIPIQLLTITTDQSTYHEGNPISISGYFNNSHNGTSISISLQSPNGHLSPVHNIINENNNYSTTIPTGNNTSVSIPGLYTLTTHYGTETASTTFDYYLNSDNSQEVYFIPDVQYLTLSDQQITKWNKELTKWQNAQNRTNNQIELYYDKLDRAITRNQTNQIELFTERIGYSMALSSLYDGLIECLIEELELLS